MPGKRKRDEILLRPEDEKSGLRKGAEYASMPFAPGIIIPGMFVLAFTSLITGAIEAGTRTIYKRKYKQSTAKPNPIAKGIDSGVNFLLSAGAGLIAAPYQNFARSGAEKYNDLAQIPQKEREILISSFFKSLSEENYEKIKTSHPQMTKIMGDQKEEYASNLTNFFKNSFENQEIRTAINDFIAYGNFIAPEPSPCQAKASLLGPHNMQTPTMAA